VKLCTRRFRGNAEKILNWGLRPRPRLSDLMRLRPNPSSEHGSYWAEVPRFTQMWADHQRRWPERQAPAEPDRSADLAGTYRSRGGFKLDPERHAETVGAIGQMRKAEPSILLLQAVIALDAAVEACQPAAAGILLLDRLHVR
jgi:hypothetical protein